jgi:hypothetical protein
MSLFTSLLGTSLRSCLGRNCGSNQEDRCKSISFPKNELTPIVFAKNELTPIVFAKNELTPIVFDTGLFSHPNRSGHSESPGGRNDVYEF